MPTKNIFLTSLLAPACSHYPFLYTIRKRPLSSYMTGMSLNCHPLVSGPSSGMTLNCKTAQTMDDMPSGHHKHLGHLRHLGILSYWTDDMPSSHSSHLRHPGHLSHVSYLGTISNIDTLNPYSLDTTLTDSPLEAFITELDPEDPGPPEGYYKDDLLDPLPTITPLLPHTPGYTSQTTLDGHFLDIPLDALDGHSSLLGEDT
jgi:hypothetical protein